MKREMLLAHMDVAERYAKLSKAKRLQVGSIMVKEDRVISIGYNGTPSDAPGKTVVWGNDCEYLNEDGSLTTRPETIHAEANMIAKVARCGESAEGSTVFVTHSPCLECAKTIAVSGVKNLYFRNLYKSNDGLNFLDKYGVCVTQLTNQGETTQWESSRK